MVARRGSFVSFCYTPGMRIPCEEAGKATAEAILRNYPASALDYHRVRRLSRHHYHAVQFYHEGGLGATLAIGR